MLPTLCRWPILAYLPHRGVQEALYIAFEFCANIRSMCMDATPGPWTALAGQQRPGLCGGLLFSLDMKQAFDRLPRSALKKGLSLSHCPPEMAELFLHWLDQAQYHVHHRGLHQAIPTTCGVRQGCKASPLQWTAFLMYLMHEFGKQYLSGDPEVYRHWMIEHLLTYADDLLLRWKSDSEFALRDALKLIGHLLDLLVELGMEISLEKTVALLRLTGLKAKQILKRHVHWFRGSNGWQYHGGITHSMFKLFPVTPTLEPDSRSLPLNKPHLSIAFKLDVQHMADSSTGFKDTRVSVMLTRPNFGQLALDPAIAMQFNAQGSPRLRASRMKPQISRLGVCSPKTHLQESWLRALDRLRRVQSGLAPDDYLQSISTASIEQRIMQGFEGSSQREPDAPMEAMYCPYCDHVSKTTTEAHAHLTRVHKALKQLDMRFFEMLCKDSHNVHTVTSSTPPGEALSNTSQEDTAQSSAPTDRCRYHRLTCLPYVNMLVQKPGWPCWKKSTLIRKHCILCFRHFASGTELLKHLNLMHHQHWSEGKFQEAIIIHRPKAHPCHAVRQLAILKSLVDAGKFTDELETGVPIALRHPVPDGDHAIPEVLKRRKTTPSSIKRPFEFHPGRDSADGTATCSHCHQVLRHHYGLRTHIESGSCKSFNPARPVGDHVPYTWPELRELVRDHEVEQILARNDFLMALKASCVLCGRQTRRPGAIFQHLLQDHRRLLDLCKDLDNRYQNEAAASGRPCRCGSTVTRKGHKCIVYTQVAIMHYALLPVDPLFLAAQSKSKPSPPPVNSHTDDIEANNDKAIRESATYFWQSPTWRQRLSTTCALCHIPCELADMDAHLTSYHTQWIDAASRLATLTDSPYLDCCQHCLNSSEVVERCPVALAFLLASDGQLSHQPGRRDGADGGRAGSNLRKPKHEKEETTHSRRGDIRDLLRANSKATQPSHRSDVEAQGPPTGLGTTGPVHHIPASLSEGRPWAPDSEDAEMEEGGRDAKSLELAQERTLATPGSIPLREIWPTSPSHGQQRAMEGSHCLVHANVLWRMALPDVVRQGTTSQDDGKNTYPHGQDASADRRTCGDLNAAGPDHPLQVLEGHGGEHGGIAGMPLAWLIQVSTRHQRLWELLQLLSGSALWLLIQARLRPHQMRENPLARLWPRAPQTATQRRNDRTRNTCYQNAAVLSMGWAILHLNDGMWSDFGDGEAAYVDLCSQESLWVSLDALKTFQPFLQDWCQGRQQDVHEFTQAFLHWMKPPSIGVSWHSRLEREGIVQISDSGAKWMPPTVSTSDPTCKHTHVQELLDGWQTYRGMSASFQTDSRIIGVHVDRYALDHSGQPCKQVWRLDVSGTILFPIQPENTLRVDLIEYQVIAGVVHIGGDQRGHLQAVGRDEAGWFLFDDDAEARLLPDDGVLRQHWTFLWLIKADACSQGHPPLSSSWS